MSPSTGKKLVMYSYLVLRCGSTQSSAELICRMGSFDQMPGLCNAVVYHVLPYADISCRSLHCIFTSPRFKHVDISIHMISCCTSVPGTTVFCCSMFSTH